jgi:hypothetical protein
MADEFGRHGPARLTSRGMVASFWLLPRRLEASAWGLQLVMSSLQISFDDVER